MIIMKTEQFIGELKKLRKGVFRENEACRILGNSRGYCNLYLHRLVKRGRIFRLARGTYALPECSILEMAGSVIASSYVTGLAALFYHGVINQEPLSTDVARIGRNRKLTVRGPFGTLEVHTHGIPKRAFFGYARVSGNIGEFLVADKEKAIIDLLLFYGRKQLFRVQSVVANDFVDRGVLGKYAAMLGKGRKAKMVHEFVEEFIAENATAKRIGETNDGI
jgi:predicted transcriptional regulator of viral defense system